MRQGRLRRARRALLIAAFTLPFTHTAVAVDIHYARAIGDPYEYRLPAEPPETGGEAGSSGASEPIPASDSNAAGEPRPAATPVDQNVGLPGLGTEPTAPGTGESGRIWPRVLIGVLLVGAMAALASKGGGGEGEVQVNAGVDLGGGSTGGAAPPPSSSSGGTAPSTDGGSGSAGAGSSTSSSGGSASSGSSTPIITVGTGNSGGSSGSGGRGGGRSDDDDDDDDDDDRGKGKSNDKKRKK